MVDSIDDWYELSGNSNGFVGEGDLDGLMPTLEEVRSWPVNFIRYYGAAAFAEFYGYDLPTVAQWKLAARGGEDFEYATSDGTANAGIAWINIDGPGGPPHKGHVQPIDSNSPNPLGIYHLGGNVWEWVKDWYRGTEVFSRDKQESDFYLADNPEDAAHLKGLFGGSFNYFPATMKVSWNHAAKPNTGNDHFGFRVVINEDDCGHMV
jgi:formylglycine-generating enzyme required for sulfatase activity